MCFDILIILTRQATIPCAGSASGSRTTAGYLRGVFQDDQLDLSTTSNLNESGGKVQQQSRDGQPGRGSCERGAHAKKCELEGHIKKRLSWLNTQQVPENNNFLKQKCYIPHTGSSEREGGAEHRGGQGLGDQDGPGGDPARD